MKRGKNVSRKKFEKSLFRLNYCADCRLQTAVLSSKNDPLIKYACMQIRVLLCPESGTTVSINCNEPVIKCACMIKWYNCDLLKKEELILSSYI